MYLGIIAYPQLSRCDLGVVRLFGPGLGNLLFPWARAVVFSAKNNAEILWPTWPQFKLGPWIRRDLDKRSYVGLFEPSPKYITGCKRLAIVGRSLSCVSEEEIGATPETEARDGIVRFSGMQDLFLPIIEDSAYVKQELLSITKSAHLRGMTFDFSDSVVVHIRLGDFLPPDLAGLFRGAHNTRVPIGWYADSVVQLRRELGDTLKAWVFSDGTDVELDPVLSLPRVERLTFGSAIADLLAMSSARILVASSTFSMWASYLGRMPVLWHPGQLRQRLYTGQPWLEVERSTGAGLPDDFVLGCRQSLAT